jgi:cephalosporin hydroxylase
MSELRQDAEEFSKFLELAKRENVRSYLEIGCRFGGSLWRMASALPIRSRIVGVDLPQDRASKLMLKTRIESIKRAWDAHLIIGDSADPVVIEKVRALGPFDLCFIDGNHEADHVWADWHNYGGMARLVAFHDISRRNFEPQLEIPEIWNKIKGGFPALEIKHSVRGYGIGVIWR